MDLQRTQDQGLPVCCGKVGTCIDAFIDNLEAEGKKFFENKEPQQIVCYATACGSNKDKHCTMMGYEGNIFSIGENGQCQDFYPGNIQG